MRILVATDFSTRSHSAVRRAGLMARSNRSDVMLMHVVEGLWSRQVAQDLHEARRMILEQIAIVPELLRNTCEPIVIGGDAPDAILDAARAWEADLIVAGGPLRLRGRHAASTARRLIHESACPVLIVRQPVETAYEKVLAPVELTPEAARALHEVRTRGLLAGAELTVLHVFEALAKASLSTIGLSERHILEYVENWRARSATELTSFLDANGLSKCEWALRVEEGQLCDVVGELAANAAPDLVVVGEHERKGIIGVLQGSLVDDLFSRWGPDLLVIPAHGAASDWPTWLARPGARKRDWPFKPWFVPTPSRRLSQIRGGSSKTSRGLRESLSH